mmetsp:Transcript_32705/g.60305  ORF Transcript_32705/g.60305 Transcript_32705/m.60305 type:complete len:156 (+) Transcript_32705:58-525(+)
MSTIESPHPDIATPELKIVFSIKFEIETPVVVPNCPRGTRVCFPITGGKFQGGAGNESFYGDIIAPSSDWATMYGDEPGLVLDVRMVFQTHDGKVLLAINGRSKRQEGDPNHAEIHSSVQTETGAEEYKWMNKKILYGKGVKDGTTVRVNYYEIL